MRSAAALRGLLLRLEGRGYAAYREIAGATELAGASLHVDRVQPDPFAPPSRVRLVVPAPRARLSPDLLATPLRRVALADHLARRMATALRDASSERGQVWIDAGGQEVLERSCVRVGHESLELHLTVELPASGRRIRGAEAADLLLGCIPHAIDRMLDAEAREPDAARRFVECVENQEAIRRALPALGLVAFLADGSILPRESGASDLPLGRDRGAVPWRSPDSLRVRVEVPHAGPDGRTHLEGTGVPRGVTVLVGGGFHGKSTVLRALARGIHPHVPGDGREGVASLDSAVVIRAEDGRRVEGTDIHGFIGALPQARDTRAFRAELASGSTSQAASLAEALEVGAGLLLFDEDTSATNFLVRDARMQALVPREAEPITPLVDRVRALHEDLGVSSVLVMGGSGDYLDVADTVIRMRDFRADDATAEARRVAAAHPTGRRAEPAARLEPPRPRIPLPESFAPAPGRRGLRAAARGCGRIEIGGEPIDVSAVSQIFDPSQARAIALGLRLAAESAIDGKRSVAEVMDALEEVLDRGGFEALCGGPPWLDLARPRRLEIAAALNRLRSLRVRSA
jgi:predicted ABC-class ATPase